MNNKRDSDAIIAAWLEDGPTELADPTRRSIVTAAGAMPQRRTGAPWRSLGTRGAIALAVSAVALAAVALLAAYLLARTPNVGSDSTPTPTPTGERGSALQFDRPFEYVIPLGSGLELVSESADAYLFEVGGEAGNRQGVNVRVSAWGLINPCSPSEGTTYLRAGPEVVTGYLRSIRGFEVSAATEATISGLPALSVDVVTRPESGCEAITLWPDMPPFTDQLPPSRFPTTRMIATEVGGANVVIVIWAEDLAAWLPTATSFVQTLHFQ
jgi:hypothetical protein